MVLARYGVTSALRDWKRSVWLVLGVMIGLTFYLVTLSLGNGYTELVRLPFSRLESDLIVQVGVRGKSKSVAENDSIRLPFSNQTIDGDAINGVASLNGVKRVSSAIILWHQDKNNFVTLAGIDQKTQPGGPAKVMEWISKGRALKHAGEAVAESHYARFNKLKVGDTISLQGRPFHIVGITSIQEGASLAAANFYIPLMDARSLAGMAEGTANLLSLELDRGIEQEPVRDNIGRILPGAIISSSDSISHMLRGFTAISSTAARLLSIVALIFTILLSCWLITGRLQEQRWQVGLMQTLGWQKKHVILAGGFESLTLVLAGSLAGIALSALAVPVLASIEVALELPWNLSPTAEGMHHGQAGRTMLVPLPVHLSAASIFSGLAATVISAVATGLITASRLTGQGIRKTLFEG